MNADLEKLIVLQRLDSAAHDAQRRLGEAPEREKALDARLAAARDVVASAKAKLAESQNVRRDHEKTVALKVNAALLESATAAGYQSV